MQNPNHYTAIDPPPKVIITEWGKGRTRQSERDKCNINTIMAKYEKTGILPIANRETFFADVTQVTDYRGALENVRIAQQAFRQLPATIRTRFDNDPALFLDFTADPENRDEMIEMGLIEKPEETPPPVEATDPPPEEPVT